MFETALKYVMGLLIESSEVQKFPKDFISASMKWVRSWFLIDDPSAQAVVSLQGNEEAKQAIIEAKLSELLKNEQFIQELNEQIEAMQAEREKLPITLVYNTAITGDNNLNSANIQNNTVSGDITISQS